MNETRSPSDLPRHSFIDIDPETCAEIVGDDCASTSLIRDWVGQGRPLIARRRVSGDEPDRIPAGLPLPPGMGKRRLAVMLSRGAVRAVRPPPLLAAIRDIAPVAWRVTIADLLAFAAARSLIPRVFGSFAWQAETGLDYVTATSDLDLIWPLDKQLPSVLRAIAAIEESAPGRLDGDVVGPLGAVHWRELATDAREVLVKTSSAVTMVPRDLFVSNHL